MNLELCIMNTFVGRLVEEVRKRELLWNKWHEDYYNRSAVDKEWSEIATIFNKNKEEVKSKWRNLRDQFQREIKRFCILPNGEVGPYIGQWCYFHSLYFLKDVMICRSKKGDVSFTNETSDDLQKDDDWTMNIKENCLSPLALADQFEQGDGNEPEFLELDPSSPDEDESDMFIPTLIQKAEKRKIPKLEFKIKNKMPREITEPVEIEPQPGPSKSFDFEFDDDLCFAKSLVPFLKKLKPVRKLIVRNEIQSLLIRELLCDSCKRNGQQTDCPCNS